MTNVIVDLLITTSQPSRRFDHNDGSAPMVFETEMQAARITYYSTTFEYNLAQSIGSFLGLNLSRGERSSPASAL